MLLVIYLVGVVVSWYVFHRMNVNKARDGKTIEDPGSIFFMGFFWPMILVIEGMGWVGDAELNGYKAYVERQAAEPKSKLSLEELKEKIRGEVRAEMENEK